MSTPAARRHGGRILADALVAHGVTHAFGVPGESYLPVLDGLHDVRERLRFVICRQVDPQLKAVDLTFWASSRHLFVQDSSPGRHPLDIARADGVDITEAVAMAGKPLEHVSHCLDAPVRVRWEAGDRPFKRVCK